MTKTGLGQGKGARKINYDSSHFPSFNLRFSSWLLFVFFVPRDCTGLNWMLVFASQGYLLAHNQQQGVIISNHSLVIQGVSRTTAGNYSCVGFNAEGQGTSPPFQLNVLCKCHRLNTLAPSSSTHAHCPRYPIWWSFDPERGNDRKQYYTAISDGCLDGRVSRPAVLIARSDWSGSVCLRFRCTDMCAEPVPHLRDREARGSAN